MTFDYKKMIEDREAGTQGPWHNEDKSGPQNQYAKATVGVWSEALENEALAAGEYEADAVDEAWVCGIWGKIDARHLADARRIARIPDMEAEIIRLREELQNAVDLIEGELTGAEWKRACRAFIKNAHAELKGDDQ